METTSDPVLDLLNVTAGTNWIIDNSPDNSTANDLDFLAGPATDWAQLLVFPIILFSYLKNPRIRTKYMSDVFAFLLMYLIAVIPGWIFQTLVIVMGNPKDWPMCPELWVYSWRNIDVVILVFISVCRFYECIFDSRLSIRVVAVTLMLSALPIVGIKIYEVLFRFEQSECGNVESFLDVFRSGKRWEVPFYHIALLYVASVVTNTTILVMQIASGLGWSAREQDELELTALFLAFAINGAGAYSAQIAINHFPEWMPLNIVRTIFTYSFIHYGLLVHLLLTILMITDFRKSAAAFIGNVVDCLLFCKKRESQPEYEGLQWIRRRE